MNEKKKSVILIAGYYGFGNAGDEAILSAILVNLKKQRKNLEFIVISSNPADTERRHGVRAVHWKDVNKMLDAARESDLVILGGGGIFQDYWGTPADTQLTEFHWGISFYSSIGLLATLYDKPFMVYSVGVGPLITNEGKRWTRFTFELADAVTVRDSESKALLAELGFPARQIAIKPDPALTLAPDAKAAADIFHAAKIDPAKGPIIGVSLRNWTEGEKSDAWKKEVAEALDRFLEAQKAQVVFIPFQVSEHELENDHSVAREIKSMMKQRRRVTLLSKAYSPQVLEGLIARCRMIVGMRLHSLIFAASVGVPSVALVYDPKVANLMKLLGLSKHALDLQTMNVDQIASALGNAWNGHKEIQRILSKRGGQLKQLAQTNTTLALKLLDGKIKRTEKPVAINLLRSLAIRQTGAFAVREQDAQRLTAQVAANEEEIRRLLHQIDLRDYNIQGLHKEIQGRVDQIAEKDQAIAKIQQVANQQEYQIHQMLNSNTWKLGQVLHKIKVTLMPPGGFREKIVRFFFHWLYRKPKELYARARTSIRVNGFFGAILKGIGVVFIRLFYPIKKRLFKDRYDRELGELERIIARHKGFFDLFHIPMGWNTMLFQRFQHVSLQSAKLGGVAIYGGHPTVDKDVFVYKEAAPNLYVYKATDQELVNRVLAALEKKASSCILRIESIDLVTTAEDVEEFVRKGFKVVYEYIDEISPHITGNVPDLVHKRHEALLKDERVIVVATSDQLVEEVRQHRSTNYLLSTNGVDLDNWRIPKGEPPADMKPAMTGKVIVAYHGALAQWIDYDLLRMIADEGSYELVLIGHEHDGEFEKSGLKSHPRVHFLGSKHYVDLNKYAVHYDIAILPFKRTPLTDAVSPVKIFEYMAALKPVVTTNLRECRKYKSCLTAETNEE
ncbi:MAG: polysaccharide pyruvyl transferase CsaB, partial [Chloroflexi bacterium]|nr:polysaccharide pyruvyl transferase CsaB [Chloroflexota bacterium]